MREIRYVILDPTGNLTALVLDPVSGEERTRITAALMDRCEQVGYLCSPEKPGVRARLQMMGGEFCGNASMAAAVYLAAGDGLQEGRETEIILEVSGADTPVACRARREKAGWRGTVQMPALQKMADCRIRGRQLKAVFFPGMVHLIWDGDPLSGEEAELTLRKAGELFSEPAAGLLQWRETAREAGEMTPLVWVRESKTMVWETACGSGTAAIACWKSLSRGQTAGVSVSQPGGILRAEAEWSCGKAGRILLSGTVRLGEEQKLVLPA